MRTTFGGEAAPLAQISIVSVFGNENEVILSRVAPDRNVFCFIKQNLEDMERVRKQIAQRTYEVRRQVLVDE